MDLLKISILLAFLTLSWCATEKPKENDYVGNDEDPDSIAEVHNKPETTNRRFLYQSIRVPKNPQCVCLQNVPYAKKISEHLNPKPGTNYERLVVYLFRNPITQETKMYVPNSDKQQAFPDIAFEIGEILKPLAPNAINVIFDNITSVIRSWVKIINKENTIIPHNPSRPDKSYIIDVDIIDKFNKEKVNGILNYLIRYNDTKNLLGTLTGRTLYEKLSQLKRLHPNIYREFMTKLTKLFPAWLNKGSIERFKPGQLHNFPYDIKLIPYHNGKQIIMNGQLEPHINVEEITVYTPEHNAISDLVPDMSLGIDITFDRWLNVLVNILNKELSFASKTIDFSSLKAFIVDALKKQGYSILDNGLVDSFRNFIKFSNIILRPILIGESGLINRVINNGLFRIPTSIVFIESLLKSGQSIMSLGIIPISHIFDDYNEDKITTTIQVIETITSCDGGHCETKKICKNVKGQVEPCNDFSGQTRSKASSHIVEKQTRSGGFERLEPSNCYPFGCKHNLKCTHESCTNPVASNNIVLDSNYRSPLIPANYPYIILDTSGNLVSPRFETTETYIGSHKPRVLQHTGFPRLLPFDHIIRGGVPDDIGHMYMGRSDKAEQNREDNQPTPLPDDDEVPGIRIIGGKPATGSGTPVSSRG